MSAIVVAPRSALSFHSLHSRFLSILPRIELHGRICFRHLKCPHRKEDAIAEMVALAWKWFVRLDEVGKDAMEFPATLAHYAARAVKSGRQVCGQEKAKDVLSATAQKRHHFAVETLPTVSTLNGNALSDALQDNTQTPPPDQVAFRLDFPAWLQTRSERDRCLAQDLMVGERTLYVSTKYGLTQGRISQLRSEFHDDWQRFCESDKEQGSPGRCYPTPLIASHDQRSNDDQ
jgi:hypothetical protein